MVGDSDLIGTQKPSSGRTMTTQAGIELVFLALSLLSLASTYFLQVRTDERLDQIRLALNDAESEWIEIQAGIQAQGNTTSEVQAALRASVRTMLPYDQELSESIRGLEESILNKSLGSKEMVVSFQKIQERVHTQERSIRSGYQTMTLLSLVLLAFSAFFSLAQNNKRKMQEIQLKQDADFTLRQVQLQQLEQQRLSRELHDGVAQNLARAKLLIQIPSQKREACLVPIDSALHEIRMLCTSLRSSITDSRRIDQIVQETIDNFMATSDFFIEAYIQPTTRIVWQDSQKFEINRIFQEAFANIIKHANATHIKVAMLEVGHGVKIQVEDNGTGIQNPEGLGMTGMRERCDLLGGSIEWTPASPSGTKVTINIPSTSKRSY